MYIIIDILQIDIFSVQNPDEIDIFTVENQQELKFKS